MFKKISLWLSNAMSEAGKARIVANIEKSNSTEYQMIVANHHFVNSVIDDILADPYWYDIAVQAIENKG